LTPLGRLGYKFRRLLTGKRSRCILLLAGSIMHRTSWLTVAALAFQAGLVASAVGQEPARWFSSVDPSSQVAVPAPGGVSDASATESDDAYAKIHGQPASLTDQSPAVDYAALDKRLTALEKPPIKYPANIQLSGVFQADGVLFNQDAANRLPIAAGGVGQTIQNGADFRRARLGARAALANNVNAFMQFDFAAQGRPTFTDLWLDFTDLPVVGTVRIGQWKQPFSLEVVSSFRYTTFMERSLLFQTFTPFRHLGIGAYNHAANLTGTWALSYFRTGQDQFGGSLSTRGGNGFAGRLTRLPWYDEADGRSYLHLGGGYFFNTPPNHAISFRTIPEIFVGEQAPNGVGSAGFAVPGVFNGTPFFANTGTVTDVNNVQTFGLEGLWVYGPLSVQSEAMVASVDRDGFTNPVLHGEYVQVGWFLTGEHRPYDRVAGAIDRVRPFEDFFWVSADGCHFCGKGAWEVAVRYSHLDLDDKSVSGGIVDDVTFGVNWYANAYCKLVFNYIHSWRQSPTSPPSPSGNGPAVAVNSEANAFGLRAQMDF
jgi:phosphate-selective porin OprO and OprP